MRSCGCTTIPNSTTVQPLGCLIKHENLKLIFKLFEESYFKNLCTPLHLQIQKILSMYTPANEYEERVPVSVIRLVTQRSGADRADPAHLMADVNHILPIDFLYTPSDVSFQTLTIPKAINLDFVVKI